MTFFSGSHWLFTVKTFVAGMTALAVSFWLDLPRPYWALASVYIASQPLSGATTSKAAYRAAGTLLGAAGAVLMVPNLVDTPLALALAMSIWAGLCLYLALLDRTPRGYVFMLAGYTAAIVGFPAVDAPETIFDLALSRTEEILVGIACAALVSNSSSRARSAQWSPNGSTPGCGTDAPPRSTRSIRNDDWRTMRIGCAS